MEKKSFVILTELLQQGNTTNNPTSADRPPEAPAPDQNSDSEFDTDLSDSSLDDEMQPDTNNMTRRTVKGAHLVYKKPSDDGSFEELWIYSLSNLKDDMKILKAILAGTDIPDGKLTSDDGQQSYNIWTAGNAQMVCIEGLPN